MSAPLMHAVYLVNEGRGSEKGITGIKRSSGPANHLRGVSLKTVRHLPVSLYESERFRQLVHGYHFAGNLLFNGAVGFLAE